MLLYCVFTTVLFVLYPLTRLFYTKQVLLGENVEKETKYSVSEVTVKQCGDNSI